MTARPAGRTRPFHPSKRDLAVLQRVGAAGIATFNFLRENALKDCTAIHAHWVLRKLVHHEYLIESRCDCGNVLGWRINLRSEMARQSSGKVGTNLPAVPHYRTAFQHDQILNEMMELLCGSPAVKGWVREPELKREKMKDSYRLSNREHRDLLLGIPDGLMILQRGNHLLKIAIELELTQKSSARIRKKLESYITDRSFNYAFFIMGDEHLKALFISTYQEILRTSTKVEFSIRRNGIYFALLSEVRGLGLKTKFSGLKNSVAIADFH